MRWIATLASRLRAVFRRARIEEELDAELQFHLDQQLDEHRAGGMSVAEARSIALRAMGSVTLIKEQARESLGVRLIDDLRQDVRYAGRGLLKSPGFTLAAVLALGLGIGVTTTLFSVLRQAIGITVIGLVIGLSTSFALRRVLLGFLYGVSPHDTLSLVMVLGILIGATAAASYIPARRATKVEPLVALRCQ